MGNSSDKLCQGGWCCNAPKYYNRSDLIQMLQHGSLFKKGNDDTFCKECVTQLDCLCSICEEYRYQCLNYDKFYYYSSSNAKGYCILCDSKSMKVSPSVIINACVLSAIPPQSLRLIVFSYLLANERLIVYT